MKKRMISLLLAAGMLLSLTACGSSGDPVQEENKPEAEVPSNVTEDGVVEVNGLKLGTGLSMDEEPVAEMDANPDRTIDRGVTPIVPVPDTMLDGTVLSDEFYYYRNTLDPTMQQAYDLIRSAMLEGKKKITMTIPVQKDDIFNLYKMVIFDSPEMFWAEVNGMKYYHNKKNQVTSLEPGYNNLVNDIKGNTAKLESAVSEAMADIWSLSTDAEKAKYAHDYLTHHINYEFNAPYNQTAYSALVDNASVCAGYAHAFQYLMQQMGIPCAYVLGYVESGYHAWNVVKLY